MCARHMAHALGTSISISRGGLLCYIWELAAFEEETGERICCWGTGAQKLFVSSGTDEHCGNILQLQVLHGYCGGSLGMHIYA